MAIGEIAAGIAGLRNAWELWDKLRGRQRSGAKDIEHLQQIDTELESAMSSLRSAEMQLAQSLGYKVCKKHWPPEVMLLDHVARDGTLEVFKCLRCQHQEPTASYLQMLDREDRVVEEFNTRGPSDLI